MRRAIPLLALCSGLVVGSPATRADYPVCSVVDPASTGSFQAATIEASGSGYLEWQEYTLPSLPPPASGLVHLSGVNLSYDMLPVLGGGTTRTTGPLGSVTFTGGQQISASHFVGQVQYQEDSYTCQSASDGVIATYDYYAFTIGTVAGVPVPVGGGAAVDRLQIQPDDSGTP
ncbi:MAG: hypothetical protein ACYDAY_04265 [Candidatus Dormibacteria bacterium]